MKTPEAGDFLFVSPTVDSLVGVVVSTTEHDFDVLYLANGIKKTISMDSEISESVKSYKETKMVFKTYRNLQAIISLVDYILKREKDIILLENKQRNLLKTIEGMLEDD